MKIKKYLVTVRPHQPPGYLTPEKYLEQNFS